jgi:fructose-1,6-bisphosphatase/inositol monophosphatase family enzyme
LRPDDRPRWLPEQPFGGYRSRPVSAEIPPGRFVELLLPAVRHAAVIARALEGRVPNRPKQRETTPAKAALTEADSAAQEAILVPLLEHFPGVGLHAEEDTPSVAEFPVEEKRFVVVDPIDSTLRSYLECAGPYSVMVGLCVEGCFDAALVALPREGLLFDGVRRGGARMARPRAEPRPLRAEAVGTRVLVSHETPTPVQDRLRERGFEVAFGSGGAISVAPLIPGVRAGLRLTNPSGGISIRGRIGLLISSEAGALMESERGESFPSRIDEPAHALLVASSEEDMDHLRYALAASKLPAGHIWV